MRYVTYSLSWLATVFSLSFYYNMFGDIFDGVYSREMERLAYGFTPKPMPEFNWKINIYIWMFCILITVIALGLVMDGVCNSHHKKRKPVSLPLIIIFQVSFAVVYVLLGVYSDFNEYFFPLERFLGEILFDILPSFYPPREYWGLAVFHALIFSAASLYFYLTERRIKNRIIEMEKEHRRERANET